MEEMNDVSMVLKDVRDDEELALSNIVFILGDIDDVRVFVNVLSFVVVFYGCNEVNKVVVEMVKS